MSKMLVYDTTNKRIDNLHATVVCTWVLNGIGEMDFTMAFSDAKTQEKLLRPGNAIRWDHNQLPSWSGVIADDGRSWDAEQGTVKLKAYSAEAMLDMRGTVEGFELSGGGGSLFEQLIQIANEDDDSFLRYGNIFMNGITRQETLGESCLTHAKRIAALDRANADFWFEPQEDANGLLTWVGNWLPSGSVKTGKILKEGTHFMIPTLSEQGPIFNRIRGLGDASTQGTRPVSIQEDMNSRKLYRLRSASKVYDGNTQQTTVDENTENDLAQMKEMRKYLTLNILNVNGIWQWLRLRNEFEAVCTSVGFNTLRGGFGSEGDLPIKGMKYEEATSKGESVEVKGVLV